MKTKYCQMCECDDEEALVIHHIDGNRNNNAQENLMTVCCNCHIKIHHRLFNHKSNDLKKQIFNEERLNDIIYENTQRDLLKDAWIYLYFKKAKSIN